MPPLESRDDDRNVRKPSGVLFTIFVILRHDVGGNNRPVDGDQIDGDGHLVREEFGIQVVQRPAGRDHVDVFAGVAVLEL